MEMPEFQMENLETRLHGAVERFWSIRGRQGEEQGLRTGRRDAGARSQVTGGKQVDGLIELTRDLLLENGVPGDAIHTNRKLELPGFFRPEKKWDLIAVQRDRLFAAMEFKSHVGPSFGNNYNNRCEESIGSAADLRTAYREGAFQDSAPPWIGYLMLLEDIEGSRRPITVKEPNFRAFDAFRNASYQQRYSATLMRLLREGLYDATCFLLTGRHGGSVDIIEPNEELRYKRFVSSLLGHIAGAMSV